MISPRKDPSGNRLFQRRASARQPRPDQHYGRPRCPGDVVPALTKCNSGSTGSSESQQLLSTKPGSGLVYRQHQTNLARNDRNQHQPSNTDILHGAATLRRQLKSGVEGRTSGSTSSSSSSSERIQQNDEAQQIDRDERSNWDPCRIPHSSSIISKENRHQTDGVVPTMMAADTKSSQHDLAKAKLNSKSRDGGQTLQGSDDDDTVKMLERAKTLFQSMAFPGVSVKHEAQHHKKPYVQTAKNSKENNGNYLAERVTDMDSGGGGTYLPTYLFSPGSSSPSASNKSSYIQTSPPISVAVSQGKPIATSKSNDFVQLLDEDEGIETTTLDFLANLHVNDDDESALRRFFEDDGKPFNDTESSPRHVKETPVPVVRNQKSGKSSNTVRSGHVGSRIVVDRDQKSTVSSLSWSHGGNHSRITQAATPFQTMVAPCSYRYDELLRDPAYQHAVRAGALWQSLCSQHVRMPALWWDGKEPGSPPFGTPEKNLWTYLGRHRVKADRKLNTLIGNRGSAGRLLLHIVVRDIVTLEPIEDICCGCFHPNARGVRTTRMHDPRAEDCRDVWIGHRRRGKASNSSSTIESVLRHQNKGRADRSPLGGELAQRNKQGGIDNGNLKAVFGDRPPVSTVMVMESDLFELFQDQLDGTNPASIVLLRRYLRQRIG